LLREIQGEGLEIFFYFNNVLIRIEIKDINREKDKPHMERIPLLFSEYKYIPGIGDLPMKH